MGLAETKIVEYNGAYFTTYAKERAEMISAGWQVLDVCIITITQYNIQYVKGTITYGTDNQ